MFFLVLYSANKPTRNGLYSPLIVSDRATSAYAYPLSKLLLSKAEAFTVPFDFFFSHFTIA